MAAAPVVSDHLCGPCRDHIAEVERLLAAADVPYTKNPRLVRGLDYYVRTAFEALAPNLGAQNAVGGGGRYDGLVEALDGPPVPGVGFAVGLERLLMAAGDEVVDLRPEVYVIPLAAGAAATAFQVARRLRLAGVRCELEASGRSLKSAMRRADKLGAHFALLLGDDELRAGKATLRDMQRQIDHRLALALDDPGEALAEAIHALGASPRDGAVQGGETRG